MCNKTDILPYRKICVPAIWEGNPFGWNKQSTQDAKEQSFSENLLQVHQKYGEYILKGTKFKWNAETLTSV